MGSQIKNKKKIEEVSKFFHQNKKDMINISDFLKMNKADLNRAIKDLPPDNVRDLYSEFASRMMILKDEYRSRFDYVCCHVDPSELEAFRAHLADHYGGVHDISWDGEQFTVGETTVKVFKGNGDKIQEIIDNAEKQWKVHHIR